MRDGVRIEELKPIWGVIRLDHFRNPILDTSAKSVRPAEVLRNSDASKASRVGQLLNYAKCVISLLKLNIIEYNLLPLTLVYFETDRKTKRR